MDRLEAQEAFMDHKPIRHMLWRSEAYVQLNEDGLCRNHNNRTVSPDVFLSLPSYDDGWEIYEEPKRFAEEVTDPALLKKFRESNNKIIKQGGGCSGVKCHDCVGGDKFNGDVDCFDSGWSKSGDTRVRLANAKLWNEEHPEPEQEESGKIIGENLKKLADEVANGLDGLTEEEPEPELPYVDIERDPDSPSVLMFKDGPVKAYTASGVMVHDRFMGFLSDRGELMGLPLMWRDAYGTLWSSQRYDHWKEVRAVAVRLMRA